jgi:hypothetical protein
MVFAKLEAEDMAPYCASDYQYKGTKKEWLTRHTQFTPEYTLEWTERALRERRAGIEEDDH